MFDLEKQIQSWRKSVDAAIADQAETGDELESHLRDQIDQLVSKGQSPQAAFEAAVERLGGPKILAAEYRKASMAGWWPARIAVGSLVAAAVVLALALSLRASHGKIGILLASHTLIIALGYFSALAVGAISICAVVLRSIGSWSAGAGESLRKSGMRIAAAAICLTLAGIILGSIWSSRNLGAAWQWDPREIGGLCVLTWSVITLACYRSRVAGELTLLVVGIVGNLVVIAGWFGPAIVLAERRGVTLDALVAWPLGIAVIAHLLCLTASAQPMGWLGSSRDRKRAA